MPVCTIRLNLRKYSVQNGRVAVFAENAEVKSGPVDGTIEFSNPREMISSQRCCVRVPRNIRKTPQKGELKSIQ
jgi:hypothetical protein